MTFNKCLGKINNNNAKNFHIIRGTKVLPVIFSWDGNVLNALKEDINIFGVSDYKISIGQCKNNSVYIITEYDNKTYWEIIYVDHIGEEHFLKLSSSIDIDKTFFINCDKIIGHEKLNNEIYLTYNDITQSPQSPFEPSSNDEEDSVIKYYHNSRKRTYSITCNYIIKPNKPIDKKNKFYKIYEEYVNIN